MKKTGLVWVVVLVVVALLAIPTLGLSRGDANGDSSIDMKDVLVIRKNIAGMGTEMDAIAADANGDNSVDMKDVLLLRKYIAGMGVELAPMPDTSDVSGDPSGSSDVSGETSETQPGEITTTTEAVNNQVTLTVNLTEEVPQWETNPISGVYTYNKGDTATVKVKVPAYQDLDITNMDAIKGFVNLTGATLVGDPDVGEIGREVEHYYTIIYTYTVDMTGDKTVSGTINSPVFESSAVVVEGNTQPTQPGETTTTQSGDTAILTLNLTEEAPRWSNNPISGTYVYNKGETAVIKVKVPAYQDLDTTNAAAINGFVNLTGATLVGTPDVGEIGREVEHYYTIIYTYNVVMNSNVTVTGTINSPVFESSAVEVEGKEKPTAAGETTTTAGEITTTTAGEIVTTTTAAGVTTTQAGVTTTTQAGVITTTQAGVTTTTAAGSNVTLTLNLLKKGKYSDGNVTDTYTWSIPKGQAKTVTVALEGVYKANDKTADQVLELLTMDSAFTLVGNPVIGPTVSQKNTVTFTYTVTLTSSQTLSGTVAYYKEDPVVTAELEGTTASTQPGATTTKSGATTTKSGTTTTKAQGDPTPVTGSDSLDLVTLTYHDTACSEYGVSFHSFSSLSSPKVQLVKGTATKDSDFASATNVTATQTTGSIKEFDNYNASTYAFDYVWQDRSKMVTGITTYIHKAVLTGLDYSTTYSYRVGDSATGTWSPIYTFTTRAATISDFSFIYTADTQPSLDDKQGYAGINALMNKALGVAPNSAFFVSGGDFVYCSDDGQGAISQWRNMINGCNNKNSGNSIFAENAWFVANGNHDNNLVQSFFNNTTKSIDKDYYSYDYGNVHFVVLDSGRKGEIDSTQVSWLQNDLSKTTKKFKIVFIHWPFYCHNERDLAGSERSTVLGLFDTYGVDFVISAHVNADYYTTYPVNNGAVTTKTSTASGGVNYYTNPGGTIYLQNGASGLGSDLKGGNKGVMFTGKNDGGKNYSYPALMRDAECGYEASFMVVKVESNKLTLNRYYLDSSLKPVLYTNGQVGVIKN